MYFLIYGMDDYVGCKCGDYEDIKNYINDSFVDGEIEFLNTLPRDLNELRTLDSTTCVLIKGEILIPKPAKYDF